MHKSKSRLVLTYLDILYDLYDIANECKAVSCSAGAKHYHGLRGTQDDDMSLASLGQQVSHFLGGSCSPAKIAAQQALAQLDNEIPSVQAVQALQVKVAAAYKALHGPPIAAASNVGSKLPPAGLLCSAPPQSHAMSLSHPTCPALPCPALL